MTPERWERIKQQWQREDIRMRTRAERRERAALALAAGSIASPLLDPQMGDAEFAKRTIRLADALLAELDKS